MKLRALIRFRDIEASEAAGHDVFREQGEVWEATTARLKSLRGTRFGDLAERADSPKRRRKHEKKEE